MKKIIGILGVMAMAGAAWAGDAGTAAAGFLKEGAGARASAMGEAMSALVDDASAVYWNPAALAVLSKRSATMMRAISVESTAYNYGAYGQRIGERWGAGIGIQHQTAGTLTGRDDAGFETGGFTPTDTAITLGAARRAGPVALGVGIKQVKSRIVDSASTMAVDVGVLWLGPLGGKLNASLTATNLGGKLSYGKESEGLPSAIRAGVGYRPSDGWAAGLDVVSPKDGDVYAAAGVERKLFKTDTYALSARAGYSTRSKDTGGLSGLSVGMGFDLRGLSVDYAFLPMGNLGQAHRVSLSYSF